MSVVRKQIDLLIREIKVITDRGTTDHNGRYLRENLRRIKSYLDGVASGEIAVGVAADAGDAVNADYAAAISYEEHLCTVDNQTAFALNSAPEDSTKVRMLINSCEVSNGRHFTVSGQSVTFYPLVADFELEINNELGLPDIILFQYIKA